MTHSSIMNFVLEVEASPLFPSGMQNKDKGETQLMMNLNRCYQNKEVLE